MAYKTLYREVSTAISDVSCGIERFKPAIAGASDQLSEDPDGLDMTPFLPTMVGLDRARREIRRHLGLITDEVRKFTKNPVIASDPKRKDSCETPASFKARLPVLEGPWTTFVRSSLRAGDSSRPRCQKTLVSQSCLARRETSPRTKRQQLI